MTIDIPVAKLPVEKVLFFSVNIYNSSLARPIFNVGICSLYPYMKSDGCCQRTLATPDPQNRIKYMYIYIYICLSLSLSKEAPWFNLVLADLLEKNE